MTAPMRRLLACVREWPECETFGYDPRCCRFPKSCSCDCYDPATVNPEDLEPLSASVTLNSGVGPTDPPEPAERLSAAAVEGKAADGSATGWESGDSSATDRYQDAIRSQRFVVTFDDVFHVPPGWLSWRCRLSRTHVDSGYADGACRWDHNVDSWDEIASQTTEHLARWHPHVRAALAGSADTTREDPT